MSPSLPRYHCLSFCAYVRTVDPRAAGLPAYERVAAFPWYALGLVVALDEQLVARHQGLVIIAAYSIASGRFHVP